MLAAAALIRDQAAAANVDRSVVAGHYLLTRPVTPEKLDGLHDERLLLEDRLARRQDDAEGLRMLSRLAITDFRWHVMLADNGDSIRNHTRFGLAFQKLTLFALAAVARHDHAPTEGIRSQLAPMLHASGLPVILENLQHRFPLMPNIALARAQVSILLSRRCHVCRAGFPSTIR